MTPVRLSQLNRAANYLRAAYNNLMSTYGSIDEVEQVIRPLVLSVEQLHEQLRKFVDNENGG